MKNSFLVHLKSVQKNIDIAPLLCILTYKIILGP